MGLFTNVVVDTSLLPRKYRHLKGWQTKDVVDPELETLEITKDGRLVYITWEREWVERKDNILGGVLKPVKENREDINYHGDMIFYAGSVDDPNSKNWKLIELKARFTEGNLVWIRPVLEQQ